MKCKHVWKSYNGTELGRVLDKVCLKCGKVKPKISTRQRILQWITLPFAIVGLAQVTSWWFCFLGWCFSFDNFNY